MLPTSAETRFASPSSCSLPEANWSSWALMASSSVQPQQGFEHSSRKISMCEPATGSIVTQLLPTNVKSPVLVGGTPLIVRMHGATSALLQMQSSFSPSPEIALREMTGLAPPVAVTRKFRTARSVMSP